MRECGLKQHPTQQQRSYKMSLPMRECGLKHRKRRKKIMCLVTPHAGVWIETDMRKSNPNRFESLPMRECGLKPLFL